jgi:hypothetical protein
MLTTWQNRSGIHENAKGFAWRQTEHQGFGKVCSERKANLLHIYRKKHFCAPNCGKPARFIC